MKKFYAAAVACATVLSMNAQIYLCGNGTDLGWDPGAPLELTAKDGKYTKAFETLSALKISTTKGAQSGDWTGYNEGAYKATLTPSTEMSQTGTLEANTDPGDFNLPWTADWTIEIPEDLTSITITTTTPAPVGPADIYVRGDMTGDGWAINPAFKFAYNEGVYTLTCTLPAGKGFKIAGPDWGNYDYGYGEIGADQIGEVLEFEYKGNDTKVAEDFTGTISFAEPEKWGAKSYLEVTFSTGEAGIAEIEAAEEGTAEYFNLQGVRVAEPAAGLYLMRRAGKVTKVLVK